MATHPSNKYNRWVPGVYKYSTVCKLTRALEVYLFNACDNIYDFIRTGWMFAKKFQLSANPNQIKRGELGLNRFIGILFKSLSDILTLKQTTDI
jgi:hypothetical protein